MDPDGAAAPASGVPPIHGLTFTVLSENSVRFPNLNVAKCLGTFLRQELAWPLTVAF